MSWFAPQNPGIGGLNELTNAEELFLTTLAGLSYSEGQYLQIISGVPAWGAGGGGGGGNIDGGDSDTTYGGITGIDGGLSNSF